jgi:predicted CXXCH cytochrome family protein
MIPVNIVPPADLPLSRDGKMTCTTCHDIHATPQTGFIGRSYFLRRAVIGQAFCEACHRDSAIIREGGGSHARDLGVAHMKFTEGSGGRIDKVSLACLSCHNDGSLATKADVKIGTFQHGMALSPGYGAEGTHPIGVKYSQAAKRGGFVPLKQLNPKIRLFKGKVGCASCHDIYSKLHNRLVMSNEGSKLCLACHVK